MSTELVRLYEYESDDSTIVTRWIADVELPWGIAKVRGSAEGRWDGMGCDICDRHSIGTDRWSDIVVCEVRGISSAKGLSRATPAATSLRRRLGKLCRTASLRHAGAGLRRQVSEAREKRVSRPVWGRGRGLL